MATLNERAEARAQDLIGYIDRGITPYHVVRETARRLEKGGYARVNERDVWSLKPGARAYVTRNGSSLIAFEVGKSNPATGGFKMIGAHTDSPSLKLKPRAVTLKQGYRQVGVEVYGGVLQSTWFDRDLSIAGRLLVKEKNGGFRPVLIDLEQPMLRIPNLAIHLNREVNTEGFKINAQNHLPPIWGLEGDGCAEDALFERIAGKGGVDPGDILDHDLSLYDTQRGTLSGHDQAFIQTARLDNLASCYAAVSALLETTTLANADPTESTRMAVLYDHEEVGSRSAQGAAGPFLRSTLERLVEIHPEKEPQGFARAMASSFLISADMAHAVHPNYSDRHEPQHMPVIGRGPVIKSNANQSYATDGESAAVFADLCRSADIKPQSFVTRTDLGCGSTIGPITAAQLGVKTVDVGNPMLSMHSCREMAGAIDVELMHTVLCQFFKS